MTEELTKRPRYGEAFWRSHHESWKRSELNQREYCESQGLSLKAFGNWRAKFKAEIQKGADWLKTVKDYEADVLARRV